MDCEKSANPKTSLENSEPVAVVLARMLNDMEFLGLIEFKADVSYWVVSEQKIGGPDKQKVRKAA
jgi:hypothetical protein